MEQLSGTFRLFLFNSKLSISKSIQYRFNFILGVVINLLYSGIAPIVQLLIITQTKGYPGWNVNQVILFQGILLINSGIRNTLFGSISEKLQQIVRMGTFDRLLLKPYYPIWTILSDGFLLSSFPTMLAGITVTVYSINVLSIKITLEKVLLLVLILVCGIIFSMALEIVYCSIEIMVVYVDRIKEFFDNFLKVSEYPVDIFTKPIKILFSTAVPFAIWAYFPTNVLLDRIDIKLLIAAIVCIALLFLSLSFWNRCMKKYTSAGG